MWRYRARFRVGMPLSIRHCRAIAACAPSYDLVAPPTLHPAASTFCSCGGFCFVPLCGASGCVNPAGFTCDNRTPRRPPVVAFLPRPSTTDVAFASTVIARNHTLAWRPSHTVQTQLAQLWRLLPSSSSSSSSSTSWCDRVPFRGPLWHYSSSSSFIHAAASAEVTSKMSLRCRRHSDYRA
jgi:hypothetical protein